MIKKYSLDLGSNLRPSDVDDVGTTKLWGCRIVFSDEIVYFFRYITRKQVEANYRNLS